MLRKLDRPCLGFWPIVGSPEWFLECSDSTMLKHNRNRSGEAIEAPKLRAYGIGFGRGCQRSQPPACLLLHISSCELLTPPVFFAGPTQLTM